MQNYLLLGAGFSRNWGGWVASEAFEYLLGCPEIIGDARLHDLRHTAGTFAALAGANAFAVRDLLGHRTLAMTGRYVERAADMVRATADAVSERVAAALNAHTGRGRESRASIE